MTTALIVNGERHEVQAPPETPLLYVLRNEIGLRGPKFGCGMAQCGVCSVLVEHQEIRACVVPLGAVAGQSITTLEGLPALWARERGSPLTPQMLHPIQRAWIDGQVLQCGYCQSGMMIRAASLLHENRNPTRADICIALEGHICRCGTHMRILAAIEKAAAIMREERAVP